MEPLYEDGQIVIHYCMNHNGAHILNIGDGSYFLDAGILDDLATTPRGDLTGKLDSVNPAIVRDARQHGMSVDSIGMALAQARVRELEKELSNARSCQR